MKSKFLIPLLLVALFFSCKSEKRNVEIIPDYDSIYIGEGYHYKNLVKDDEITKIWKSNVIEIKNILNKEISKEIKYPFLAKLALRFYFNEEGKLEKVKLLNTSEAHYYIFEEKYNEVSNPSKLVELLIHQMDVNKLFLAVKNGKTVKYRTDFIQAFFVFQDGRMLPYVPLEERSTEHGYSIVDEMPKPIGGIEGISKRVIYPEEAKRKGIEGKVFVNAVVDEKGDVVDFSVTPYGHLDDPKELLMRAAADAVRKTKFTPGRLKGKPVKVITIIPIKFELEAQQ